MAEHIASTPPDKAKQDKQAIDPKGEKKNFSLNRRHFLLAAIGLPTALVAKWFADEPKRFGLVLNSIRQGEPLKDLWDILNSRFRLVESPPPEIINETVVLPDMVEQYLELEDVETKKFRVGERVGSLLFLNIGNNTQAIRSSGLGNPVSIPVHLETLLERNEPLVVLPMIQAEYGILKLYTSMRDPESGEVVNFSAAKRSPHRGGVVVYKREDGFETIVLDAAEFNAVSIEDEGVVAMQEFAYTLSLETMASTLEAMDGRMTASGKTLSFVEWHTSMLVTFQLPDGNHVTELIASFQNFTEPSFEPVDERITLSVLQFLEIIRKRSDELGATNVAVAIPDPGENSGVILPEGISPLSMADSKLPIIQKEATRLGVGYLNEQELISKGEVFFVDIAGVGYYRNPYIPKMILAYTAPSAVLDRVHLKQELDEQD